MPMEGFVFVQLSTAPDTLLVSGMLIEAPGQKLWFETAVTTGSGLIVIVNVLAGPVQPSVAVTLTVPTTGVPLMLIGAVYEAMLPVPLAARPIPTVLVQLNVSPPPVFAPNVIAEIVPPEQTTMLLTVFTTGVGWIVIVKVFLLEPVLTHVLPVPVTVIVPTMSAPVALLGAV